MSHLIETPEILVIANRGKASQWSAKLVYQRERIRKLEEIIGNVSGYEYEVWLKLPRILQYRHDVVKSDVMTQVEVGQMQNPQAGQTVRQILNCYPFPKDIYRGK